VLYRLISFFFIYITPLIVLSIRVRVYIRVAIRVINRN
jgi:hypothetical protein